MTVERNRAAVLMAVPLALLLIAGCGGGNNKNSSSPTTQTTPASTTPAGTAKGSTLKLSADPGGAIKFNTAKLQAKSGSVTLLMSNPSSSGIQHGIAVEGNGVDKDGPIVGPGKTSTLKVDLKPGKYEYYCPFDGHKAQGMTGTLTVK
jgi:plastocyanin